MSDNELYNEIKRDLEIIKKEQRDMMIELAVLKTKLAISAGGISFVVSIVIPMVFKALGVR